MAEEWVEALRTMPAAVPQVAGALRRAGIPHRVERGNPHVRALGPARVLEDPDTIWVPAGSLAEARTVLAAHGASEEARIRGHLARLPGELAVGACLVGALVGVVQLLAVGPAAAWPWGLAAVVAAPFAWRRLRRGASPSRRPGDAAAR